jgi:hypothetical protein
MILENEALLREISCLSNGELTRVPMLAIFSSAMCHGCRLSKIRFTESWF